MDGLINTANAIRYAGQMFDIGYLPAIIGSAVIIFAAVYLVRFILLK